MDEFFSIFLDTFGSPVDRKVVPESSIERYRGKLPNKLLEYWDQHGWCGYGGGIFWIVNPQDYEGVVASWIAGTKLETRDVFHLIARSAFGDLYLWGEQTGYSLKIVSLFSRCVISNTEITSKGMDFEMQNFILSRDIASDNFEDMFQRAVRKLGTLRHDEMYGFVPALVLGGPEKLDNLQKLKTVEHLTFLSQISELEPYSFSDL